MHIKIHAILSVWLYLRAGDIRGNSSVVRGEGSVVRRVVMHVGLSAAVVVGIVLGTGHVAPCRGVPPSTAGGRREAGGSS